MNTAKCKCTYKGQHGSVCSREEETKCARVCSFWGETEPSEDKPEPSKTLPSGVSTSRTTVTCQTPQGNPTNKVNKQHHGVRNDPKMTTQLQRGATGGNQGHRSTVF